MSKRLMRLESFWLHTISFVAVIGIGVVIILFGEELRGILGNFHAYAGDFRRFN